MIELTASITLLTDSISIEYVISVDSFCSHMQKENIVDIQLI